MKRLALMIALATSSFAAEKEIRCRFTAVDAHHKPIKPHQRYHEGMQACVGLIHTLAIIPNPEGLGVQVKGSKKQRRQLEQIIDILQHPEQQQEIKRQERVGVDGEAAEGHRREG